MAKTGVHGTRHLWQGMWMAGGVRGRGYVWQGGLRGRGACITGKEVCGRGLGVCGRGHVWQGGLAWQERRPLQRAVRILLECILIVLLFVTAAVCLYDKSSAKISIFGKND